MPAQILIVEDERIMAEDLRDILAGLGYAVTSVVSTGREALIEAEENAPDLALMDICIQGDLDGTETARILRERFNIPVIYLTAHADRETLEHAKAAQPLGYITKPFREIELQGAIEMALHKNSEDLKSQARALTERLKAQELLRMFAEAAPNAMMIVGADGRITLVNAQAEKLFGYDRRELLSQSIDILVPERYRANHSRQASAFFSGTSTRAMGAGRHLFGLRKDGSEVPIEIGLNPITTTDGELAVVASIIDVTERLKAQQLLEQSLAEKTALLAEKTTLLKEVHHRVKNNLQVICSLLSMQISSSDSDASRLLNDAYSRVLTMSLIHEQVFQSDTLAHLNFGEYVELLSGRLFSAYCIDPSRIRVELNVEAIRFAMDDAIPCGLILNELLTNALKHAFNDGRQGLIRIDLRETKPGHAELAVADNGMGLPPGFRLEESRSHGLQVVRTLIQQLQADLVVIVDGGTTFRFGWKLSEAEALPH